MWIVATDQAYENWIEVFETREEAQNFFVDEIRRSNALEELIDEELLAPKFKLYIAKVDDWSIIRY